MFVSVLSSWLSLFFLCSRPSSRYSVESSFRFYFLFPVKTMFCSLQFLSAFVFSSNLSLFSSSHSSFSSQFQTLPFPFSFLLSLFLVNFSSNLLRRFACVSSLSASFVLSPLHWSCFFFCPTMPGLSGSASSSWLHFLSKRRKRGEGTLQLKTKEEGAFEIEKNSEIAKRKVLRKVKK